jgi:MoaA/NifB/PqqE/SkfB family radical SAM enzyme
MTEYNCLESINAIYVRREEEGYAVKPCCVYNQPYQDDHHVQDPNELFDNPYINKIREGFKGDWAKNNPGCAACVMKEKSGKPSKRLGSLKRGPNLNVNNIPTRWDLRPGNTCNLKCIMCNLRNSSKWIEDNDIANKFNGSHGIDTEKSFRKDMDWNWVYNKCKGMAEIIYIAGGEPFYMKNVRNFLKKLSEIKWNCDNTTIQIQTNGVTNSPALLEILSKFSRVEYSLSIDGWAEVNELIRFPTIHQEWIDGYNSIKSLDPINLICNLTIQSLNLPNIQTTLKELHNLDKDLKFDMHLLEYPNYLSINALKPQVIEEVKQNNNNKLIAKFIDSYNYDRGLNVKMQKFLQEMDTRRGTNSKVVAPWCYV